MPQPDREEKHNCASYQLVLDVDMRPTKETTISRAASGSPEARAAWQILFGEVDEIGSVESWMDTVEKFREEVCTLTRDGEIIAAAVILPMSWNRLAGKFTWSNAAAEADLRKNTFIIIHQVAVRPDHRRRGVGTQLYRYLDAEYPHPKLLHIRHEPYNSVSASFHRAMGFIPVGLAETPQHQVIVEGWYKPAL